MEHNGILVNLSSIQVGRSGIVAAAHGLPLGKTSAQTPDVIWETNRALCVFVSAAFTRIFGGFFIVAVVAAQGPITCIIIGLAHESQCKRFKKRLSF